MIAVNTLIPMLPFLLMLMALPLPTGTEFVFKLLLVLCSSASLSLKTLNIIRCLYKMPPPPYGMCSPHLSTNL